MYGCLPSPLPLELPGVMTGGGGPICACWADDRVGLAMARPEAAIALARPVGLRVVDRRQGRLPPLSGAASVALVFSRATGGIAPFPLVDGIGGGGEAPLVAGNLTSVGDSTIGRWITTPCSLTSGAVAAREWLVLVDETVAMSGSPPFLLVRDLLEGCLRIW